MANEKRQTIFEFIQSTQVQAIITLFGLLVVILNLYIASRLSPLVVSINSLEARADSTDSSLLEFVPRRELELTFHPIQEDISEIKQDVKEIKNLLNAL